MILLPLLLACSAFSPSSAEMVFVPGSGCGAPRPVMTASSSDDGVLSMGCGFVPVPQNPSDVVPGRFSSLFSVFEFRPL